MSKKSGRGGGDQKTSEVEAPPEGKKEAPGYQIAVIRVPHIPIGVQDPASPLHLNTKRGLSQMHRRVWIALTRGLLAARATVPTAEVREEVGEGVDEKGEKFKVLLRKEVTVDKDVTSYNGAVEWLFDELHRKFKRLELKKTIEKPSQAEVEYIKLAVPHQPIDLSRPSPEIHVNLNRNMRLWQRQSWVALQRGCFQERKVLTDGRPVLSYRDASDWLLEQLFAAFEKKVPAAA